MKNFLFLIIALCSSGLFAQNPDGSKFKPESKEYKEYYTTLLDMYKKMYDSELAMKVYEAKDSFMTKANFDQTLHEEKYQSLGGEGAMLTWIEDNFEKTEFKSMDEARELFKIKTDTKKQLRYANTDLYKYFSEALKACEGDITGEVWNELIRQYGLQFHF